MITQAIGEYMPTFCSANGNRPPMAVRLVSRIGTRAPTTSPAASAPAGALLVLLPVYMGLSGFEPGQPSAYVFSVYTVGVAFLLVSRLPVWSGKALGLKIPRTTVIPLILAVALAIMLLAAFTFEALILLALGYLAAVPLSFVAYRRREQRELAAQARGEG